MDEDKLARDREVSWLHEAGALRGISRANSYVYMVWSLDLQLLQGSVTVCEPLLTFVGCKPWV